MVRQFMVRQFILDQCCLRSSFCMISWDFFLNFEGMNFVVSYLVLKGFCFLMLKACHKIAIFRTELSYTGIHPVCLLEEILYLSF